MVRSDLGSYVSTGREGGCQATLSAVQPLQRRERRTIMTVIKRNRQDSCADLVAAIDALLPLLKDQKETEAANDLSGAAEILRTAKSGSAEQKQAVEKIVDAFEGDHELMAYTYQREGSAGQWTE